MNEDESRIGIRHGSGTGLSELLQKEVLPVLGSLGPLEDAAVLEVNGGHLAFTTDSFVVQPLFFPGGDIGKLAACGTLNDLAMMGARPLGLSVSLILEEGLPVKTLREVLRSLRGVCDQTGVSVVCGDTKVVERTKADGVFINTSGIGLVVPECRLSVTRATEGDAVIVSGPVGLHGVTILAARKGLGFASEAESDCAPLVEQVAALLRAVPDTRVLRDATRGGCAAVLNEIADGSNVTIELQEERVPVPPVVSGACSFLGMDPLHMACEGRFVAIVPGEMADEACRAIDSVQPKAGAAVAGHVAAREKFAVVLETSVGGTRVVSVPPGELQPRIC